MTKKQTSNYIARVLAQHNISANFLVSSLNIGVHKQNRIVEYVINPDLETNNQRGGE